MPSSTTQVEVALIAAAGAFLVAWIAGGFSLLGLIISKEQQVSGFRQAWIDALRADLAVLVAHAYEIQSFAAVHKPYNSGEFWSATRDDYVELNQASMRIKFRLNPGEIESKAILETLGKLEALFTQLSDPQATQKISEIVSSLERDAPSLLKKEWTRVKKGELVYRIAKGLAALIFAGAAIFVVLLLRKIH
jgi:hypothetical protein